MKELEGMTIGGKKVFVREPEEEKVRIPCLGKYARIIQLYLEDEYPELLEQMKQAKTIIPYLTELQEKIAEKIMDSVQTEISKHPEYGFIQRSRLNNRTIMETEEMIFHDLFPISSLDLPIQADIIGGIPYHEAEEMGFLENV